LCLLARKWFGVRSATGFQIEMRRTRWEDGPLKIPWLAKGDAAVNVNIWLSPEQPNQRGGGLEIYRCAPGRGSWTADFNRVLAAGEEDVARAALRQGGVDRVAYKQNRACIFVSHRYHASEAFDFPDEQNPRVNLTLLFGDRSPAQDRRR
ncbi:unnamed protein product, partial [Effrenium voratum]